MIKIIIIQLFIIMILISSCDKTNNKYNLNFENAGSQFIDKRVGEIKKVHHGLSIEKNHINGFKISDAKREIYNIYPDTTDEKITAYEILSDSICFMNICPGDQIKKVKKLFPDLPIMINEFSQKEYFEQSNQNINVKINVTSNLQGQVVGSYTQTSPSKSQTYSFDGYVRSILVEKN